MLSAWSCDAFDADNAALVDVDETTAGAEFLPVEANELASAQCGSPAQRQQWVSSLVAGSGQCGGYRQVTADTVCHALA
jgi:hypothetical protein